MTDRPNIAEVPFEGLDVGFKVESAISERTGYRDPGKIARLTPADRYNPNRIGCLFSDGSYVVVSDSAYDVLLTSGPGAKA